MRDVGSGDVGLMIEEAMDLMNVVANKKATYPDEINAITGLRKSKITNLKARLVDAGVLENLNPKKKHSDKRLLSRRSEMWSRGKTGQSEFGKRSWIGLNSGLKWRLVYTQDSGNFLTIDEYHNPVYIHQMGFDKKPIATCEDQSISDYVSEALQ